MENRTAKLFSGLFLVLFALGLNGCQMFGSEKSSEANNSTDPKDIIEAEEFEPNKTIQKETPKVAKAVPGTPLTAPTDPGARIKAIRKGRSNPMAPLVNPNPPAAEADSKASEAKAQEDLKEFKEIFDPFTKLFEPQPPASSVTKAPPSTPQKTTVPRISNPAPSNGDPGGIVLPPLPTPTLAKQVSVQGVMMLGGQPKAIVKAPNENVTRTVQAGDFLSNGQIQVSAIDMSNPQNPQVVLSEAGQTIRVGVGKTAETAATSEPESLSAVFPF